MTRRRDSARPSSLKMRLLFTLSICAILAMAGRSLVGDRGLFEVWRKKGAYQKLAVEVQALRVENVGLRAEIQALRSDPSAIERIAREELGYSRPGEISFVFREDEGSRLSSVPLPHR
jgi:cell division protein FtsB